MMLADESVLSSRNSARSMRLIPNEFKTIGARIFSWIWCLFVFDNVSALLQHDFEVMLEAKTNLDLLNPIFSLPA